MVITEIDLGIVLKQLDLDSQAWGRQIRFQKEGKFLQMVALLRSSLVNIDHSWWLPVETAV